MSWRGINLPGTPWPCHYPSWPQPPQHTKCKDTKELQAVTTNQNFLSEELEEVLPQDKLKGDGSSRHLRPNIDVSPSPSAASTLAEESIPFF